MKTYRPGEALSRSSKYIRLAVTIATWKSQCVFVDILE
jgi:hypothetical protein